MFESAPEELSNSPQGLQRQLSDKKKKPLPEIPLKSEIQASEKTRSMSAEPTTPVVTPPQEVKEEEHEETSDPKTPTRRSLFDKKPEKVEKTEEKETRTSSSVLGRLLDGKKKSTGSIAPQDVIDQNPNAQPNFHIFEIRSKKYQYVGDFVNNMV
jgi:hypothetical protein